MSKSVREVFGLTAGQKVVERGHLWSKHRIGTKMGVYKILSVYVKRPFPYHSVFAVECACGRRKTVRGDTLAKTKQCTCPQKTRAPPGEFYLFKGQYRPLRDIAPMIGVMLKTLRRRMEKHPKHLWFLDVRKFKKIAYWDSRR